MDSTPDAAGGPIGGERFIARTLEPRYATASDEVQTLLDTTYAIVAETGSFDPPIRAILKRSGLSTTAFYRHFRSKDELMLALTEEGTKTLLSYLRHRIDDAPDEIAKILAFIDGFLQQPRDPEASERARPFAANDGMLASRFPVERARIRRSFADLLEEQVRAAVVAGACRTPDAARDAEVVADYLLAALNRHLLARTVPDAGETTHLQAFTLRALGADRTS